MIIASCGSQTGDKNQAASENSIVEANISELLSNPLEYDSKTVEIEGVISHVCRHTGNKMRVLQDGSDLSILVMLEDFTGEFDVESEGQRVALSGQLVAEVTNIGELAEEADDCETSREAVEAMKAKGLDADINTYVSMSRYERK